MAVNPDYVHFLSNTRQNDYEIDIAAVNNDTLQILCFECKWQDKKVGIDIYHKLMEKAGYVKYLKEDFDKIEELKEDIHTRDMQIIDEHFSKGGASGGWESFLHMLESSAGKELGREALETIRAALQVGTNKTLGS